MSRPCRIEGLAIISADGMIADAAGVQPDALKIEADQRFFFGVLDKADVLVHGRHSAEGSGAAALRRRRIVLTRTVTGTARDPGNGNAALWNPAGASFQDACGVLGLSGGTAAIIGGTEVFGLFLEYGYDAFHLTQTGHAVLPGGRPVFPGIPPHTAQQRLAGAGLIPGPTEFLDPSAALTLTTWTPARR